MEEAYPEAAAVLRDAGWKPHPEYKLFTLGTLVTGITPDGATLHIKDWAKIQPGHPLYSENTPDTALEAAEWLREKCGARGDVSDAEREAVAEFEGYGNVPESQEAHNPASEAQSSVDSGDESSASSDDGSAEDGSASGGREILAHDGSAWEGDCDPEVDYEADYEEVTEGLGAELLDDLVGEAPALEGFAPEQSDYFSSTPDASSQDRFIGLDDLDRRRSLRIGDVMRYANALMPAWALDDDARLSSLRNFSMGVQENRWPDDAAKRNELEALEGTLRLISQIKAARDAKVVFLEGASREEIEDFSVEADWP